MYSKGDIYQWMEDENGLSPETLPELIELIDTYPWFHTARILYLKNLASLKNSHLGMELKKMSVSIPDRRKLYVHIEGKELLRYLIPDENKDVEVEDTFLLIDSFLSSHADDSKYKPETSVAVQPSVSTDYIYWAYAKGTGLVVEEREEESKKLKHHDLIDSFLEEEENRPPGIRLPSQHSEELSEYVPEEQKPEDTNSLDDSYFTETLARIYIKQKRYDKALQIIKNLSLKYPEKNVYFADQIRFLEKLIINTKK